jgi:hypothetical protein
MKTRVKMLKVKIKTLAEEARIIRLEERRAQAGSRLQGELHGHRVGEVRHEQRCSLLAYAFLRGIPYASCEKNPATQPDWKRVAKLVEKFGAVEYPAVFQQSAWFERWKVGESVKVVS